MVHWLDLALIGDEETLVLAINALGGDQQRDVLHALGTELNMTSDEITSGLIRLLVERARPLALPARLWSRNVTSSDDPREIVRKHWTKKKISATQERIQAATELYNRFVQERIRTSVTATELERSGFRCRHCGIAFCNEQLETKGIISPHGNRGRDKLDTRKPHWNSGAEFRGPTHDHIWPVSTYGDNSPENLQVLCSGM